MYTYQRRKIEPLLVVEGVSLRFGDNLILKDVSVEIDNVVRTGVAQGQVVGFLGPSGRGKTQLSRILAGLNEPTTGSVMINLPQSPNGSGNNRQDLFHLAPVHSGLVGYVTQDYRLFEHRTAGDNLLKAGRKSGLSRKVAQEKANEYLQIFELESQANLYPEQLSGGQRQRFSIAQQLMCNPHYIVMDEPVSGLDPIMKEKVCHLIVQLSLLDELTTTIVITHDIRSAVKVSDTLWLLGQDRDEEGNLIPGSYIKKEYDLAAMDLAWHEDIADTKEFNELATYVEKVDFQDL